MSRRQRDRKLGGFRAAAGGRPVAGRSVPSSRLNEL